MRNTSDGANLIRTSNDVNTVPACLYTGKTSYIAYHAKLARIH